MDQKEKEELKIIWEKIEGLTPNKLEREIQRASAALEAGKLCIVRGHSVNSQNYLSNLEGVKRGIHPAFSWISTDVASFYGRPSDPKKIVAVRKYST